MSHLLNDHPDWPNAMTTPTPRTDAYTEECRAAIDALEERFGIELVSIEHHEIALRELAAAKERCKVMENWATQEAALRDAAEARAEASEKALLQIKALAEYATTGPETNPRCKSDALTAAQATSLRGAISEICDAAIAEGKK